MATSKIIRLTDAVPTQAQLRLFSTPIDTAKGLSVTFDFFSYGGSGGSSGGTGGDGFSFSLIDGNQSLINPGGFGGSLGYAQRSNADPKSGITGGYLGIGFDEFGNFSSGTEGRVGGNISSKVPDAVAVRGSQATNYKFLTGTQTLPKSLDVPYGSRRHPSQLAQTGKD